MVKVRGIVYYFTSFCAISVSISDKSSLCIINARVHICAHIVQPVSPVLNQNNAGPWPKLVLLTHLTGKWRSDVAAVSAAPWLPGARTCLPNYNYYYVARKVVHGACLPRVRCRHISRIYTSASGCSQNTQAVEPGAVVATLKPRNIGISWIRITRLLQTFLSSSWVFQFEKKTFYISYTWFSMLTIKM